MSCMLFSAYLFLDLSKSESLCILFLRCGNIWMCVSAIDYKCTECLRFWPCDPVSVLGFKRRPWAVSRSGSTRREGEESATGLCVRLSGPLLFAMFVSWPHESSPPPFHLLAAFGLWCGILFFFLFSVVKWSQNVDTVHTVEWVLKIIQQARDKSQNTKRFSFMMMKNRFFT